MAKADIYDVFFHMVKFSSPQYIDYIFAEVDGELATQIAKDLENKFTIAEEGKIIFSAHLNPKVFSLLGFFNI